MGEGGKKNKQKRCLSLHSSLDKSLVFSIVSADLSAFRSLQYYPPPPLPHPHPHPTSTASSLLSIPRSQRKSRDRRPFFSLNPSKQMFVSISEFMAGADPVLSHNCGRVAVSFSQLLVKLTRITVVLFTLSIFLHQTYYFTLPYLGFTVCCFGPKNV